MKVRIDILESVGTDFKNHGKDIAQLAAEYKRVRSKISDEGASVADSMDEAGRLINRLCDKCFLMGKVLTELSALYSENEKRIIDRLSTSEGINKTNLPLNNKVEKLGPALEGMFVNDNKG